jgi:Z1 domain
MKDPILKSNVEAIRAFVQAGLSLQEATERFEQNLRMNGAPPEVAKQRAEAAMKILEAELQKVYESGDPRVSTKPKVRDERWYFGPKETDHLWPRYRHRLKAQKGLDEDIIRKLDTATDRIVMNFGCPGSQNFRRQGLVVGRVQSGKTSNFMGVIAKAGDAGYRIIIVLAGTTNTLRYQTQDRLQRDLVGFSDTKWQWLTQAKCDPITLVVDPQGEFNEIQNATPIMGNPNARRIAVIKKNASVLRRVKRWLQGVADEHKKLCPVLILDDECDNASVNTGPSDESPTIINELIRDILAGLPKVTYVGYTATPFANVLINPDAEVHDLYPHDFIFALPLNRQYFGPERIFGNPLNSDKDAARGNDIVREIPEEDLAKVCPRGRDEIDGFRFDEDCQTLKSAIRYFIMSCAARVAREKSKGATAEFKSMLINTSQFVRIQQKAERAVAVMLRRLRADYASDPAEWRRQWEDESSRFTQEQICCAEAKVEWPQVAEVLSEEFMKSIKVVVSNSSPNQASNLNSCYDSKNRGSIYIVIGGNTLSRGMTLEGLTVSYFTRNSTTYDTLLQMGRWFGYRKGYEDMPRIWMTKDMQAQFIELAGVEYEMFEELEHFMAGKSPSEIGVRIRQCPGMQITARAKMRNAEVCDIDYTGFCIQTTFVHRTDEAALLANREAISGLVQRTGGVTQWQKTKGFWLRRDVDFADVLTLLDQYKIHERNQSANADVMRDFLKKQKRDGKCTHWNIAIKTKQEDTGDDATDSIGGLDIKRFQFSRLRLHATEPFAYLQAIKSSEDVFADAPNPDVLASQAKTDKDRANLRATYENGRGLIVIYPIRKDSQPDPGAKGRIALDAVEHPFGMAIFFPGEKPGIRPTGGVRVRISNPVIRPEETEPEEVVIP